MSNVIVAVTENGVIGVDNDLSWRLKSDLKHFKDITTGHTVVMGRNTFKSIYNRLNGPLPNRRNIIMSTTLDVPPEGFEVCKTLDELSNLIDLSSDEVFIIGGSILYESVLKQDFVSKVYFTLIHATIDSSQDNVSLFPTLSSDIWQQVKFESFKKDDNNDYDYDFIEYARKNSKDLN